MDEEMRTQLAVIAAQARALREALASGKADRLDREDHTHHQFNHLLKQTRELLGDHPAVNLLPSGIYPSTPAATLARLDVMSAAGQLANFLDTLLAREPGRIEELEREMEAVQAQVRDAEARAVVMLDDVFDSLKLHPRIARAARSLFGSGHYAQAIFEAFKAVTNMVKDKSGLVDLDGAKLMARAFDQSHPVLKVSQLRDRTEKDEQEGFKLLFMGSALGIRNPKAHTEAVQSDPFRTLEYLAFASLLAKRVDEAEIERSYTAGAPPPSG